MKAGFWKPAGPLMNPLKKVDLRHIAPADDADSVPIWALLLATINAFSRPADRLRINTVYSSDKPLDGVVADLWKCLRSVRGR